MSVIGLLLSLLLASIVIAIVARPLFSARRGSDQQEDSRQLQHEKLRHYYERVVTNIRDLDEDYSTGKISAEDHQEEREVWVRRGIQLLRALDESDDERTEVAATDDAERIDTAIEAAVAGYREGGKLANETLTGEETP